jgi:hypothetical protein
MDASMRSCLTDDNKTLTRRLITDAVTTVWRFEIQPQLAIAATDRKSR